MAQTFRFSHGEKIVQEERENLGIMRAWAQAWTWRDREIFVIIEDDVEMSPHWYRAAANMWRWDSIIQTSNFLNSFCCVGSTGTESISQVWASRTRRWQCGREGRGSTSPLWPGDSMMVARLVSCYVMFTFQRSGLFLRGSQQYREQPPPLPLGPDDRSVRQTFW